MIAVIVTFQYFWGDLSWDRLYIQVIIAYIVLCVARDLDCLPMRDYSFNKCIRNLEWDRELLSWGYDPIVIYSIVRLVSRVQLLPTSTRSDQQWPQVTRDDEKWQWHTGWFFVSPLKVPSVKLHSKSPWNSNKCPNSPTGRHLGILMGGGGGGGGAVINSPCISCDIRPTQQSDRD